jgi:DNA-binding transcriptional LysR family regulator
MVNLPVRHIQTLVCLADTGSFRLAAERLKLSQPAVSTHIRDLEIPLYSLLRSSSREEFVAN